MHILLIFIKASLLYSKFILIPKTIAFSQLHDVINALYGAYQIHTPIIAVQKIEQLPLKTLTMKLVGFLIRGHP